MIPKQNTPEWREWRNMKIGASDAPIIMGMSPWKNPVQLWKEKLGFIPEPPMTDKMQRGVDLEPAALEAFNAYTNASYEPLVMIHKQRPWMIASLDGWEPDSRQGVEIKCPGPRAHKQALEGTIHHYYVPQLQHQIEVANLDRIHYWSFDGEKGVHLVCERDQAYIDRIMMHEKWFYQCMLDVTEPIFKYD